jgi:hypothetical protein
MVKEGAWVQRFWSRLQVVLGFFGGSSALVMISGRTHPLTRSVTWSVTRLLVTVRMSQAGATDTMQSCLILTDHSRRLSIHVYRRPIRSGEGLHLLTSHTMEGYVSGSTYIHGLPKFVCTEA